MKTIIASLATLAAALFLLVGICTSPAQVADVPAATPLISELSDPILPPPPVPPDPPPPVCEFSNLTV